MDVQVRRCPWCDAPDDRRELTSRESARLTGRIFWQSAVFGAVDVLVHRLDYVSAIAGPKGREQCCRGCDRLLRICPRCDTAHRWLSAQLLTCECGLSFL